MTKTKYPKHKVGTVVRLTEVKPVPASSMPIQHGEVPEQGSVGVVVSTECDLRECKHYHSVHWFIPPPKDGYILFEYDELEEVRDGPT